MVKISSQAFRGVAGCDGRRTWSRSTLQFNGHQMWRMPFDFHASRYSTIELAAMATLVVSVTAIATYCFHLGGTTMKAGQGWPHSSAPGAPPRWQGPSTSGTSSAARRWPHVIRPCLPSITTECKHLYCSRSARAGAPDDHISASARRSNIAGIQGLILELEFHLSSLRNRCSTQRW